MEAFLASVEKRAFTMARMATGDREEALDIVQDALFGWVSRYRRKPEALWKPLFYRILNSRISDWRRRRRVRERFKAWFASHRGDGETAEDDFIERQPDPGGSDPADQVVMHQATRALQDALRELPMRQRQAFLLRAWEALSVKETALAMQCSQGSVKTHYARALASLRPRLEGYWP